MRNQEQRGVTKQEYAAVHHQLQQSQQNCTDMLEALEELEQVTAE